jgi:lysophospholipase L1-like esterase
MIANIRYVKICIAVLAWMGVLLAATHRSELPVVLGRYSWSYACLLGLLVGVAATLSLAKSAWLVKLYQGIVISGASLLLVICLAELGIRTVDPFGISYYEWLGEYQRDKQPDEHLIYRHKPSWEKRYGDVLVTYNERGLRDRPLLPKAAGEYRILALGDSVTFGWGVPQNQIFAFRLEQLLQGRLQRPVRVINSGVGGYNTVQEVTYFKQEGVTFQPDLVMLTYVQNDIEENKGPFVPRAWLSLRGQSLPEMVITMLGKLWFYRLVNHTYHHALPKQLKEQSSNPSQGGKGWSDSMSALGELVAMCEEHKIPLIVFFDGSYPGENNPLFEDVVRHAHGVPVKDMGQWLEGLDEFSLVNSKIDGHPNAEGHRVMAEHMAVEIVNYLAARK